MELVHSMQTTVVHISGTVDLVIKIGERVETVLLNVVERTATQIILGCHYWDKHVEIILPRQRIVKLTDPTMVPIFWNPTPKSKATIN